MVWIEQERYHVGKSSTLVNLSDKALVDSGRDEGDFLFNYSMNLVLDDDALFAMMTAAEA
eukprot:10927557-Ditylum_brightwellii.AAC.1